MKKLTLVLALSLLVASCGNDKRGSNYSPLNSDQKAKFASVFQSAGNAIQAPIEVHKTGGHLDAVSNSQGKQEMKQQIKKQKCEVEYKQGDFGPIGSIRPDLQTYLKVGGANCPIAMDTQLNVAAGQQSATANFAANYKVLSEEYKKLNDVIAFDLKGTGTVSGTSETNIEANGTSAGTLTSAQYGNVGIEFSLNAKRQNDKGEILVVSTFKFSDFTAELKLIQEGSVNGTQTQEIYLNGEKLNGQQTKSIRGWNFAGLFQAIQAL